MNPRSTSKKNDAYLVCWTHSLLSAKACLLGQTLRRWTLTPTHGPTGMDTSNFSGAAHVFGTVERMFW